MSAEQTDINIICSQCSSVTAPNLRPPQKARGKQMLNMNYDEAAVSIWTVKCILFIRVHLNLPKI